MTTASSKGQATKTRNNAKATARSAANTVRNVRGTAQARTKAVNGELSKHGKRVAGAAQAEVSAVASQPTRPLYFALGVADRTLATVREIPQRVLGTPAAARQRLVATVATAGDIAQKAQSEFTEVAKDGESLVASVRRQDSTQRAIRLVQRADRRGRSAVKDTEKAVAATVEAAADAASKLG